MATVFDYTKWTPEQWILAFNAEREGLPSLRRTIMNRGPVPGVGTVHFPYLSALTAAHLADGTDVATIYAAGTSGGVDVAIDEHPVAATLLGSLASRTADPGTAQKIAQAAATAQSNYESSRICAILKGATPLKTLTLDLNALGITTRQAIGDQIAGQLGLANGTLTSSNVLTTNRWCLVDPRFAALYMTTEQFASAEYMNTLGSLVGPMSGLLTGGAPWLGMGIVQHANVGATKVGGGTTTTTSLYVYQEEAAAMVWSEDAQLRIEYNPTYLQDQVVTEAWQGYKAGRTVLVKIDVTLTGNPFSL